MFLTSTFVCFLVLVTTFSTPCRAVLIINGEKSFSNTQTVASKREGCGAVCDTTLTGTPGLFFDHIEKPFKCRALWANEAIDAPQIGAAPHFPENLREDFSYGGRVPITRLDAPLYDQVYLGNPEPLFWTEASINEWAVQCEAGTLEGNYGADETAWVLRGLRAMTTVENGHILVIGSENPWVESCVLAAGARLVTTLEYRSIKSFHPKVRSMTPKEARLAYLSGGLPLFDAVVTFSSVEHSGLGRYGDSLNPWGDLQAIARAWCITRPGGELLIGVTYDIYRDSIEWNLHRIYGP